MRERVYRASMLQQESWVGSPSSQHCAAAYQSPQRAAQHGGERVQDPDGVSSGTPAGPMGYASCGSKVCLVLSRQAPILAFLHAVQEPQSVSTESSQLRQPR